MARNNNIARKIWKTHNGVIPKDDSGRSYEIHHIDGDHTNNDVLNLTALSIKDHYDIHYRQGDFGACAMIAKRERMSIKEISLLTMEHNRRMVSDGSHPLLKREDGSSIGRDNSRQRVKDGTHNLIGSPYAKKMYEDGTHPFLGGEIQKLTNQRRINDGTHNWLGDDNPSHDRVKNGTHHMQGSTLNLDRIKNGTHASQLKVSCLFCRIEVDKPNFSRSHGDKCKHKT